jgi:hypothetical protein
VGGVGHFEQSSRGLFDIGFKSFNFIFALAISFRALWRKQEVRSLLLSLLLFIIDIQMSLHLFTWTVVYYDVSEFVTRPKGGWSLNGEI